MASLWAFLAIYIIMDHKIHLSFAAQSLIDDDVSANSVAAMLVGIGLQSCSRAFRESDFLRPIPHYKNGRKSGPVWRDEIGGCSFVRNWT